MQKVSKIKKTLLSKSFFSFWKYQFLIKSYNKKVKPYKINREILNIGDVVFALCFSPEEKKFYLIKQFRPFYFVRGKNLKYEIVGGLVDKGEWSEAEVGKNLESLDESLAGQALFEIVASCRKKGIDPESALRRFASKQVKILE